MAPDHATVTATATANAIAGLSASFHLAKASARIAGGGYENKFTYE